MATDAMNNDLFIGI